MHRPLIVSLLLTLLFAAGFPACTFAQTVENSVYGPLPVFEFHSGFWVNLHHTLYQEAKFGPSPGSPTGSDNDKAPGKNRPTLKSSPTTKSALTPAEQRAWNEALSY